MIFKNDLINEFNKKKNLINYLNNLLNKIIYSLKKYYLYWFNKKIKKNKKI